MTDSQAPGPGRDRGAFAAVALALAVLFAGNNLPSALYGAGLSPAFGCSYPSDPGIVLSFGRST